MSLEKVPDYFPSDWRFGTDGIRGPVNSKMNPLFMVKLGCAAGKVLKELGINNILIGKDTRISGYMIESALESGFISSGLDVTLVGPMPTPGVAFLSKETNKAGLVISASHNRFSDNGIKFFTPEGYKFDYELEKKIEEALLYENSIVDSIDLGKANRLEDAQQRYIDFCISTSNNLDLSGLSLVVDCANGANYSIAPKVFRELGCNVIESSTSPNGININDGCGSTNPDKIKKEVISNKADMGVAFDGDGDRLVIVDNSGNILDGDDLLYVLVSRSPTDFYKSNQQGIIGTLMTNKSLESYLYKQGVNFHRTDVGDKYVLRELLERGWKLGGEPSGHIISLNHATTGDALVATLQLLTSLSDLNFDISEALKGFDKLPQKLISFEVPDPYKTIMSSRVRLEVSKLEEKLKDDGRVLIRPSGTEKVLRVMVEASSNEKAENLALELSQFIKATT